MKLALLGTGMIVNEVLPVLKTIDGIELEAILSTPRSIEKAKELARTYGMSQATSSLDELLANERVDTVYIGTPNHTHYDYAKASLEAGKHVICEKPFTMTTQELDDLVALAEARGLFLLEAITNQYLDNYRVIKDHLSQLGEIKIVTVNYSQYSSRYDSFKEGIIAPAFNPKMGGGALRDLNIYNIHFLVGLFDQPKAVHYMANVEQQVDTSGVLTLDYGDFKAVSIAAKDSSAQLRSTIQGTKGSLSLLGATNSLPQVELTLNGQEPKDLTVENPHHRMYQEFKAFQEMIATNDTRAAQSALAHSRKVMAVLEAAANDL